MDALAKFKQYKNMMNRLPSEDKAVVNIEEDQNIIGDPQPAAFEDIAIEDPADTEIIQPREMAEPDNFSSESKSQTTPVNIKTAPNYQEEAKRKLALQQYEDDRRHKDATDYSDELTRYAHIMRGLKYNDLAGGIERQAQDNLKDFYNKNSDTRSQNENFTKTQENMINLGATGNANDPNSNFSKFMQMRTIEKYPQMDPEVIKGMSAAELKQLTSTTSQDLRLQALELQRMAEERKQTQGDERIGLSRENLGLNKDKFGYGKEQKEQDQRTDVSKTFGKDKVVSKSNESIAAADNILSLINSGNPIAAQAIPTFMARAAGEVGALSEGDKKPFGGSQAMLSRAEQALQSWANGQLTVENAKYLTDLSNLMKKQAARNKMQVAVRERPKYMKAGNYTQQEINDLIMPELNKLQGKDAQAVTWALKNMGDPKAEQILKDFGF